MTDIEDRGAGRRTLVLSVVMVAAAIPALIAVSTAAPASTAIDVPWPALAIAFAVSELLLFHIEVREEAHSFSFSEVPMVFALFFAGPDELVLARVLGEVLVLLVHPRQPVRKIIFNIAMFVAECSLALGVFHLVFDSPAHDVPRGWVAAFAAIGAADLLGVLAVSTVIRWHGGSERLSSVVGAAGFSAVANSSLAVIAALLLVDHPPALLVLLLLAIVMYLVYRAYADLRQRYVNLQVLYDFTDAISGSGTSREVMGAILSYARDLLRADMAEVIVFADGDDDALRLTVRGDLPMSNEPVPDDLLQLVDRATGQGGSLLAPRMTRDSAAVAFTEVLDLKDGMMVPLLYEGERRGTITVGNRLAEVSTFDEDDRRLFEALGNHASIALQNGRLIEELRHEVERREHQAMHDALTGLPNRQLFTAKCEAALGEAGDGGARVGVLLMDVDRFKEVNDTLGHHTGDVLLEELGRRLTASMPDGAVAARFGGDEFAVMIPAATSTKQVVDAAEQLRAGFARPVHVGELELVVAVSVGVSVWPDHGGSPSTLLQRADIAMYAAKSSRTGVAVYASEHDHYTPRRLALGGELRRAIDGHSLEVHFQPTASLEDGRIVGAEALVRWRHPEHGLVSPSEFVPLAEKTELIGPLTEFVLRAAVEQCREWQRAGYDLTVSVNVAVRSFLDEALLRCMEDVLERSGLPPTSLTLEITESSIMSDTNRTVDMLDRITATGVRLSVDDFGTGHSSLAYLQRLPVHEVKIDQSFVFNVGTDDGDAAIVTSIVELGHSRGLRVVAEGVENQLTWDRLRALGCDLAQGYYLSRPIAGDTFTRWLSERQGARPPAS